MLAKTLLLLISSCLALTTLDVTPGGVAASFYSFNSSFKSLKTDVTVNFARGKPLYFWSHQFSLSPLGSANTGYIGIQGDSSLFNGTSVGRGTIFSIWASLAAQPLDSRTVCGVFGGEGTGYSCRLPFDWQDGTRYRYHVFRVAGSNDSDVWFGASVEDLTTEIVSLIGKIQVPPAWGDLMGPTVFFVEYYGDLQSCQSLPYTVAIIETPIVSTGVAVTR